MLRAARFSTLMGFNANPPFTVPREASSPLRDSVANPAVTTPSLELRETTTTTATAALVPFVLRLSEHFAFR